MAGCSQDADWHAEGDVWTHSRLVCAELERLTEWAGLTRADQLQLLLAALFHDSGKPTTSAPDPDSGRIRSPKHALTSAEIARRVLRELGCDLKTREEIVSLVRYHSRPPYILEKENVEREVISLSWLVDTRLLYCLALADTRGRHTKEMSRPEENLHLWKMVAEELGCFGAPYPFANSQARFLFFRGKLSSLHYVPREDHRCTVTLLSGLPGAGKDTWLSQNRPALPVVALDAIRDSLDVDATDNQGTVVQSAREQCRIHLRAGRNFAFNATNITRQMRQRWIHLFEDYNARIEIVYLEPPLATILAQNRRRANPVPEKVILGLLEKLEPPTFAECHGLLLVESCGPDENKHLSMSWSKHTDPRPIRAVRRVRAPFEPRAVGDLSRRRKLGLRIKKVNGIALSSGKGRNLLQSRPRILWREPHPGFHHPTTKQDIAQLLIAIGPSGIYGLRSVELTRAPVGGGACSLVFGRYEAPGRILLFEQPLPPWRLRGLLVKEQVERLERAGAVVTPIRQLGATLVDWPGDTLKRFMLEEVLLHELGHHVLQHCKAKRRARIARTKDHEAFATLFAAKQRMVLAKRNSSSE
ncbi:MAG: hypothetical protein C5B50_23845 [Verrucomicrobia bacterium]|nr:MAG: hypothetical protein C5B50_23845 [Verrucomicrobiota bacterium]